MATAEGVLPDQGNPGTSTVVATLTTSSATSEVGTSGSVTMGEVLVKENPLESLMEKLRAKANHYKPWGDMAKSIRMAIMDKRHLMDSIERNQLQKCLDTIQKSIKVTSLQSMVERLESITRQQGLKFTAGPNGTECYISSDMFYVEILLETSGEVKDVKIAHHGDPVSCAELTKVLGRGDFAEFTKHLEGLAAIYQLNADMKQKTKAYLALQALEIDLSTLAQLQSSINDPSNLVHKSPVGILQQRQGGHPMKLTYFISPYDLLDVESKSSIPLTVDAVLERGLGHSVTVCIESSMAHKLQTVSLMSITKSTEGKSLPSFAALSNLNSTTLPASFVLRLPNPIPIATALVRKIQAVTSIECADMSTSQGLLSVLIKESSEGKLECRSDQGLFVTLPDQHHCYFLNAASDLQGVLVSAIPFTHPTCVPQILVFLRQQMLFNTVISSCVRPGSKQDVDSPFMFEVTALSTSHITVSFEHPLEESLATVDLDLRDITSVKCKIYTLSSDVSICTDEYASKVMQRCLSIPITMRAVIRKAQGQQQQIRPSSQGDMYCASVPGGGSVPYLSQLPNYGSGLSNGTSFTGGDFSHLASRMCSKPGDTFANEQLGSVSKVGIEQNVDAQNYGLSSSPSLSLSTNTHLQGLSQHSLSSSSASQHSDLFGIRGNDRGLGDQNNPLLGTLLSQSGNAVSQMHYQQAKHANTMLMSMLSDVPAANSTTSAFPFLSQTTNTTTGTITTKPRKQRKRKATTDVRSPGSSTGKSPKRKLSEDDSFRDLPTPDVESTDSTTMPFDVNAGLPTSLSSTVDSSHLSRAMASLDAYIKNEPTPQTFPHRSKSTDSYLGQDNFQRQNTVQSVTSVSEPNTLSESCPSSTNPDIFGNMPQVKNQQYQFNSDNTLDFNPEFLSNAESSYPDPLIDATELDLETCDANAFGMDLNPSNVASKLAGTNEKQIKKNKKCKLEGESNKVSSKCNLSDDKSSQDSKGVEDVSDDESLSVAEKSGDDADKPEEGEDLTSLAKTGTAATSQSTVVSTSLKIAKSGDSLKVSKTELKIRQKESRRSVSTGNGVDIPLVKRKGDAKKERKKRRTESADSISNKSSVRPIHVTIDSSLMPPPTCSSESVSLATSVDNQTIRPITLNVKAPSAGSSGASLSKSPVLSKKVSLTSSGGSFSANTTKSVLSTKSNQGEKSVKSSQSSQSGVVKVSGTESDGNSVMNTKVTLSTSFKIQTKHKQSASSKFSSSGGNSGNVCTTGSTGHTQVMSGSGGSSPSKSKPATLKLKNLNLPPSTTITPIPSKPPSGSPSAHLSVSTPPVSSSISIIPTSTPASSQSSSGKSQVTSAGNNNMKASKSALRSRKGSLSAVIDKLMVSASNAQNISSASIESSKSESSSNKPDTTAERRDLKMERKESNVKESLRDRESSSAKSSESKAKYFSSDQFTVKQSSQGIKLTVTKTRSGDGSSKTSSKVKMQSLKSLPAVTSSVAPSSVKATSSCGSGSKGSSPASKKSLSSSNSYISSKSSSSTSIKTGNVSSQKNVSPSSTPTTLSSSRVSSTTTNISSRPVTKLATSSSQGKVSASGSKVPEKGEKKVSVNSADSKVTPSSEGRGDKVSTSALNIGSSLMPPPSNKSFSDHSRSSSSSNTPKRTDESPVRHSPRHTPPPPTRDNPLEESEGERAFRLLLAQTKMENQNGSEQRAPTPKSLEIDSNALKAEAIVRTDFEDKTSWVTSSTDVRPSSTPKLQPQKSQEEPETSHDAVSLSDEAERKSFQAEVSSSSKYDGTVSALLVSSSEEASKTSISSFPKPAKQFKRPNPPSDEESSPEDGLFIDCPGTPCLQKSPDKKVSWSSPHLEANIASSISNEKMDKPEPSPSAFAVKSPYQPSPLKSPAQIATPPSNHSVSSSMSRPSPCIIDDELMDEALMSLGK